MKIRSIHPGFFSDRKLGRLPAETRILFAGLWCLADDYGHGRYLPKQIEGAIFPHDIVNITVLLEQLVRAELIRVYSVRGEDFYEIPNWDRYQSPRYKAKQVLPVPASGKYHPVEKLSEPGLFSDRNLADPGAELVLGEGEVLSKEEGLGRQDESNPFVRFLKGRG